MYLGQKTVRKRISHSSKMYLFIFFNKLQPVPSEACCVCVSLDPTWTTTRFMEDGRERNSAGSLFNMSRTVEQGKQCVAALKKRTFLIIESPTIKVVGEKSGRGGGDWRFTLGGCMRTESALWGEDTEGRWTGLVCLWSLFWGGPWMLLPRDMVRC